MGLYIWAQKDHLHANSTKTLNGWNLSLLSQPIFYQHKKSYNSTSHPSMINDEWSKTVLHNCPYNYVLYFLVLEGKSMGRELQSHSNGKCKSTKKKPYQNWCPPLVHCQTNKISLLEYQGTRNFQESINFLTLLETIERVWRERKKRRKKKRKKHKHLKLYTYLKSPLEHKQHKSK